MACFACDVPLVMLGTLSLICTFDHSWSQISNMKHRCRISMFSSILQWLFEVIWPDLLYLKHNFPLAQHSSPQDASLISSGTIQSLLQLQMLKMDLSFLDRDVNSGFSVIPSSAMHCPHNPMSLTKHSTFVYFLQHPFCHSLTHWNPLYWNKKMENENDFQMNIHVHKESVNVLSRKEKEQTWSNMLVNSAIFKNTWSLQKKPLANYDKHNRALLLRACLWLLIGNIPPRTLSQQ